VSLLNNIKVRTKTISR